MRQLRQFLVQQGVSYVPLVRQLSQTGKLSQLSQILKLSQLSQLSQKLSHSIFLIFTRNAIFYLITHLNKS